jgi:undecaprenyl pyrophosphate phosphatase UppP
MVAYLQKHSFAIFGWYRILAGVCVAIAVACHWLSL